MSALAQSRLIQAETAISLSRERKRPGFWRRFIRHRPAFAGFLFIVLIGGGSATHALGLAV